MTMESPGADERVRQWRLAHCAVRTSLERHQNGNQPASFGPGAQGLARDRTGRPESAGTFRLMNPKKSPSIETLPPVPVPRRAMIPLTVLIDGRGDSMRVRVECCLLSRSGGPSRGLQTAAPAALVLGGVIDIDTVHGIRSRSVVNALPRSSNVMCSGRLPKLQMCPPDRRRCRRASTICRSTVDF